MLRVSIHAGPLATASRFNVVARVDIGYAALAPIADYKTVLHQKGIGATLPVALNQYPRWSASLWDLTARAIMLGLSPEEASPLEEPLPYQPLAKGFAFAQRICAVIEHLSADERTLATLATTDISQCSRQRGTYRAVFDEHAMGRHVVERFEFRPEFLQPAELLSHACMVRLTGRPEMPPRPGLCAPEGLELNGVRYVPIHRLIEPARTGFVRWLRQSSEPPVVHIGAPQGIAPEGLYVTFLRSAI